MKRRSRTFILDMFNDETPEVGDVYRDVGANDVVLGYMRVLEVRRVKVRVSRGEVSRWRLSVERLARIPPEGCRDSVFRNRPLPRQPPRFSPLLDPAPGTLTR